MDVFTVDVHYSDSFPVAIDPTRFHRFVIAAPDGTTAPCSLPLFLTNHLHPMPPRDRVRVRETHRERAGTMPTDYRTAHLTIEEKDRAAEMESALRDYWDDREAELDAEYEDAEAACWFCTGAS